ncbi:MAG: hypothetical protein ACTSRZ_03870 [Promethearchaeota archaeon]
MGIFIKRNIKSKLYLSNTFKILFSILLVGGIGYLFVPVSVYLNIYGDIYSNQVVALNEFMETDPQLLNEQAWLYMKMNEVYNIPYNLTGDGWDYYPMASVEFDFNPSDYGIVNDSTLVNAVGGNLLNTSHPINKIKRYGDFGHAIVYAGYGAMAEAFRYATMIQENNLTGAEESRQILLKIAKGFSILSQVTGTGFMARYVVPDTPKARNLVLPYIYKEEYSGSHLFVPINYTAPNGKTYIFYCETGTSVDCYMGVYAGLGVMYLMCNDTQIRSIIRDTVDRMLTYHMNVGWKSVDMDGKTHSMGAEAINAYPIADSSYAIMFLRVGKTVYREKWGPIYDRYVYDRLYMRKTGKHAQFDYYKIFAWSKLGGYFNVNLGSTLAIILCFLEDNPYLKSYYIEHYLKPMHDATKYHRNAWFDAGYYLGTTFYDFSSYENLISNINKSKIDEYSKSYIEASVGDALMRICLRGKSFRKFSHPNGPDSYNLTPNWNPILGAPYPTTEIFSSQNYPVLSHPLVKLISNFYAPGSYWTKPRPADWYDFNSWMWESNPFSRGTGGGLGTVLSPPQSFTCPYWIGRFLGFNTL